MFKTSDKIFVEATFIEYVKRDSNALEVVECWITVAGQAIKVYCHTIHPQSHVKILSEKDIARKWCEENLISYHSKQVILSQSQFNEPELFFKIAASRGCTAITFSSIDEMLETIFNYLLKERK